MAAKKTAKSPVCEVTWCAEPVHARGVCADHYEDLARGRPYRDRDRVVSKPALPRPRRARAPDPPLASEVESAEAQQWIPSRG